MKNLLKISTLALVLLATTFSIQAQSFGYVDSQLILSELPAVKQAESNLEALQQQLQKKLQASVESLQADYLAYSKKLKEENCLLFNSKLKAKNFRHVKNN